MADMIPPEEDRPKIAAADPKEKKVCSRCKKSKSILKGYYKNRYNEPFEMCKECMTAHLDVYDPSTFTWILEKMDYPYLEDEFNAIRDKQYAKDPYKFSHMAVFGKYVAKMHLGQWRNMHWSDTEAYMKKMEERKAQEEEEAAKLRAEYDQLLAEGKITEQEYNIVVCPMNNEKPPMPAEAGGANGQGIPPGQTGAPTPPPRNVIGDNNPFNENNFLSEEEIDDGSGNLSEDDKLYLALKWGRLYLPGEWIQLEKFYTQMKESFEINDADSENLIILISKVNLKMNQAIDNGDVSAFNQYSKTYDQLRKSGKFTAAQNKGKDDVKTVDSVGEIVKFCETQKGRIEPYKVTEPLDKIDAIIADLKDYNKALVYEDKSLARQIEDYLTMRKQLDEKKREKEYLKQNNLEYIPVTDKDISDFNNYIQEQKEDDLHSQTLTEEELYWEEEQAKDTFIENEKEED